MGLRIGGLARRTGVSAPAIRYYEEVGLLPAASRLSGGQRVYGADDVMHLSFIRRCRALGFSVEQTRVLASLTRDAQSSCMTARDLAKGQLHAIRTKMRELEALEDTLARFVRDCDVECGGRPGPDCAVLREIGTQYRHDTAPEANG